jgi:hypothetical protein
MDTLEESIDAWNRVARSRADLDQARADLRECVAVLEYAQYTVSCGEHADNCCDEWCTECVQMRGKRDEIYMLRLRLEGRDE